MQQQCTNCFTFHAKLGLRTTQNFLFLEKDMQEIKIKNVPVYHFEKCRELEPIFVLVIL